MLGIGNVVLETRRTVSKAARKNGRKTSSTITLHDVLYAPDYVCNILGGPILDEYGVQMGGEGKLTSKETGATVGVMEFPPAVTVNKLLLKGQPQGHTSLDRDQMYWINARWSDSERQRWDDYKRTQPAVEETNGAGQDWYNIDWIFSNTSNVHVANNKKWFKTFTAFETQLGNIAIQTPGTKAEGVGDVQLEIQRIAPKGSEQTASNKVTFKNVLYVPGYTCNVLGGPVFDGRQMGMASANGQDIVTDGSGRTIGLLDKCKLWKAWLQGQPKGRSSLDPNSMYWINAHWSDSEIARWKAYERTHPPVSLIRAAEAKKQPPAAKSEAPPLTEREKKWLKEHYGGEFQFLMTYGLKMFNEEDREEGRQILRAVMS